MKVKVGDLTAKQRMAICDSHSICDCFCPLFEFCERPWMWKQYSNKEINLPDEEKKKKMPCNDLTFSALAERAGMKPPRLAAKFSIPRRTAEQWVTGERTPPDYVLRMIETILDYEKKNEEAVD